jgi:hypothetical protein
MSLFYLENREYSPTIGFIGMPNILLGNESKILNFKVLGIAYELKKRPTPWSGSFEF